MNDLYLRSDHGKRLQRSLLCLNGLSVGDAFGERFFFQSLADLVIASRAIPVPPWHYTDDTIMASSIYEVLRQYGEIEQDALAEHFARRYIEDPDRGYGRAAAEMLASIADGVAWRDAATSLFDGEGSMGNGSAMRVGPVGAYFADDMEAAIRNAAASAEVTHAHPDAKAGAIAVALAAVYAWQTRESIQPVSPNMLIDFVLQQIPDGPTAEGLRQATKITFDCDPREAAVVLGNGDKVVCSDTVPFCLWNAARCLRSFEDAMWSTIMVYGDMDTTCAIIGGIVSLAVGMKGIPSEWIAAREPLPIES